MEFTEDKNNSLDELDSEISTIRGEIKRLQNRRRYISASLISTSYIHERIQSHPSIEINGNISSLALSSRKHRESNYYRVAFSTTAFPFRDPSPDLKSPQLLGLRIDICSRDGKFVKPYYVLLRRGNDEDRRLIVHRHTIPAFIPIDKLAQRYLPQSSLSIDEENEMPKPWTRKKQDLPGFTRHLRRELAAWHLRKSSIEWLRTRLGSTNESLETPVLEAPSAATSTGIISLTATSLEARYARIEWDDGRVGRFKVSDNGLVERAVVIADRGRDKTTEDAMVGRVETILERLSQRAP